MVELKSIIDANGHGLLEMPSGTGKTITILSLILAYQEAHPKLNKRLVYCTRTVPEVDKALGELERLYNYRKEHQDNPRAFLGIGLSARKNMCINEAVLSAEVPGRSIDSRCHSLTAGWARADGNQCKFYENIEDLCGSSSVRNGNNVSNDHLFGIPSGVYDMNGLKDWGRKSSLCPYFLSRNLLKDADVLIYSYYYLLDPKVSSMVSGEISNSSIVIFDEAHNIDNVCVESFSIDISRKHLDASIISLNSLQDRLQQIRQEDQEKLLLEYELLLSENRSAIIANNIVATNTTSITPIIPDDILEESIPGNIRKGEHFISFLRRFVEFLKHQLKPLHVTTDSPMSFLATLRQLTLIDRVPLRFTSDRLGLLLKTLEITGMDDYYALQQVANLATITSTYERGFQLIMEPYEDRAPNVSNPILHLACLDPTLAIKPVFSRFKSVIITSGTLSPIDIYPRILNFEPVLMKSLPISLDRNIMSPLIVGRGSDQTSLTSRFDIRNDPAVIRNYGQLLLEMVQVTPDGLVAFFPSYSYLETILAIWMEMGIIESVLGYKLIFIETPDGKESEDALSNYRKACDSGRGAVMFSVARGKISEGIDFNNHYGRAVIMFGIPYQYTESRILKARLEFMREEYGIRESDFLTFDALRHAAQCLGRVIRGKDDYGLMILADKRYGRWDKRSKLPRWINESITDYNTDLSSDMATARAKKFFKEMAEPPTLLGNTKTMLTEAELTK